MCQQRVPLEDTETSDVPLEVKLDARQRGLNDKSESWWQK